VTQSQLHPEGKAKGVARRNRPLIVLHEGEATSWRLKKRADWEARRAAGEGISATVTLPGWRDEGGTLWTRNWLVSVEDDWIGISQDMLIASVSLEQDSRAGTAATLTLKDPRALGGHNPRGSSAATWSAPGGLAPEYSEG
jgi:prophage tail gpP-like protein